MKPQTKKYKQHSIKSFIRHNCIKCKCNISNNNNFMITSPSCCLKTKNICKKCNMKINMVKYNKIIVIDNNLNIIKCSNSPMKDVFPADVYVHMSEIKNSGFGVFANKNFIKNEIIEIAPYIILENYNTQPYGILKNYVYSMKNTSNVALSLGFGSLYNCSKTPNINFIIDNDNMTRLMIFYACCDINIHDELYINYGYEIDNSMENNINNIFPSNSHDNNFFHNLSDRIFSQNDMSIDDNDEQQVLIKQIKDLTL